MTIAFDLYVIDTWDGNGSGSTLYGPDVWRLSADGVPLIHTTFSNVVPPMPIPQNQNFPDNEGGGSYPSYTGATEANTLGYIHPEWGNDDLSSVYHLTYSFPHTALAITFSFSATFTERTGGHTIANESWGIDNVHIIYDGSADVDSDGDGLPNVWETCGIDGDDDAVPDFELAGADVGIRDLYLEVDALQGRRPDPAPLADVINVFAGHGITLHVDDPIEEDGETPAFWDVNLNDFAYYKNVGSDGLGHFGTPAERIGSNWTAKRAAKLKAYSYCVFADRTLDGRTGAARLPGTEMMVALGGLYNAECGPQTPTENETAGTFMHELGHLLGLTHGGSAAQGDNSFSRKPNYPSVMNYLWQMPIRRQCFSGYQCGIASEIPNALQLYVDSWRLDYSSGTLPPLDEGHLDESAGIGGMSDRYVPVGPPKGWLGPRTSQIVPMGGPVNWDREGIADYPAALADVNDVEGCQGPSFMTPDQPQLLDFDDWGNLQLAFPRLATSLPSSTRTLQIASMENELTIDEFFRLSTLEFDCNLNSVSDEEDILAGTSSDANRNGVPDECEPIQVEGNAPSGMKYTVAAAGTYRFQIVGGAWTPSAFGDPQALGWKSLIGVFRNRLPSGIDPPPDFFLGCGTYQDSIGALSTGIGSYVDVWLAAGQYVKLLPADCNGCYGDNRGRVSVTVQKVTPASTTTLLVDHFPYGDGNLLCRSNWYAHSGIGAKPVQVKNGTVLLTQSTGSGEDVSSAFIQPASVTKLYASFGLKLESGAVMGSTRDYFAHFRPYFPNSSIFPARVWVGPPMSGGDFELGIAAGPLTSTPIAPWPAGLAFGQTYRVVIAYDALTGTCTLWLNPAAEGSPHVMSTSTSAANLQLSHFALRQASPSGAAISEVIDDVVVGTTFDKATLVSVPPPLTGGGPSLDLRVFPNPSAPGSRRRIQFSLPTRSDVQVAIYDLTGRRLQTLVSMPLDAGPHEVDWPHPPGATGVVFIQLRCNGGSRTARVTVLK